MVGQRGRINVSKVSAGGFLLMHVVRSGSKNPAAMRYLAGAPLPIPCSSSSVHSLAVAFRHTSSSKPGRVGTGSQLMLLLPSRSIGTCFLHWLWQAGRPKPPGVRYAGTSKSTFTIHDLLLSLDVHEPVKEAVISRLYSSYSSFIIICAMPSIACLQ